MRDHAEVRRILAAKTRENLPGVIRAAVVNYDHLIVVYMLTQNAVTAETVRR
jgi:hypothetical protein